MTFLSQVYVSLASHPIVLSGIAGTLALIFSEFVNSLREPTAKSGQLYVSLYAILHGLALHASEFKFASPISLTSMATAAPAQPPTVAPVGAVAGKTQ